MILEELFALLSPEEQEALKLRAEEAQRNKSLKKHKYHITENHGKWYTRLPNPGGRSKLICRLTREKLEDAIIAFYESGTNARTIAEVFEEVQARKAEEGSHSPATVTRNKSDFRRFYGMWEGRNIEEITAEQLEEHLRAEKIEKNLTAKGWANLVAVTRLIFRYARKKKLTQVNCDDVIRDMDWSAHAFEKAEAEHMAQDFFTDAELQRLAEAIKREPNLKRLGLLLLAATGLRVGELSVLTWSDYDPEFRSISIHSTETMSIQIRKTAKTKAGIRRVYIPESAAWLMDEIRALSLDNPEGFIFWEVDIRKPDTPAHRIRSEYFRKELYRTCDEVGIARRGCHAFRKTYASILLDSAVPEKYILESMGHADLRITKSAYARNRQTSKEKLQVIDGIKAFDVIAK